jgi:hypothetical protein
MNEVKLVCYMGTYMSVTAEKSKIVTTQNNPLAFQPLERLFLIVNIAVQEEIF